jgi:RNA recognition motif-containing protein
MSQPVEFFTAAPQPAIVYAGNMAPSTPVYIPQRQPVYACFPVAFNTGLMSPPSTVRPIPQNPARNGVNGPVVQTEARKVIIKGLPRDTSEAALVNLIDQFSSRSSSSRSSRPYSSSIQHVDLARHSDGRLKGHAFVVFETHRIAKKVVDAIDGYKFQSRELRATLAKEGVEPTEIFSEQQYGYMTPDSSGQVSESPSIMQRNVDERNELTQKEDTDAQWNNNGEVSSKSSKGIEKERTSGDRDRKSRPKSRDPPRGAPAVVDGSGRRRH